MNVKPILVSVAVIASLTTYAQKMEVNNGYEKGWLEDGHKVGVWEYFGIYDTIDLKIDYDKGTLVYLKTDTSKFFIMLDSVWTYKSLKSYPRYIGSYARFYRILGQNLRYPVEARRKKIEKTVFLEFEVNRQGQIVNIIVLNDNAGYFTNEIINAFNLIPNIWLPANYNGKNVPSKFILPFYFKLSGRKQSLAYDENTLNSLEGRKLREIVITAYLDQNETDANNR